MDLPQIPTYESLHKHSEQEEGSEMVFGCMEEKDLDTVNRAICLQRVLQTCTMGHLELISANHRQRYRVFLSDPGIPGVRSMGPVCL